MPTVKTSSSRSTALAADAALAAYLRTLADRRAAELDSKKPASAVGRWSAAPLARARYQRVVPIGECRLQRAVSSRGEPREAQTPGVR